MIDRNELYKQRKMGNKHPFTTDQIQVLGQLGVIADRISGENCREADIGEVVSLVIKADEMFVRSSVALKHAGGSHSADPANDIRVRNAGLRLLRKAAIDPETPPKIADNIFKMFEQLSTDHPSTMNNGIRTQMFDVTGGQGVPKALKTRAGEVIGQIGRREKQFSKAVRFDSELVERKRPADKVVVLQRNRLKY